MANTIRAACTVGADLARALGIDPKTTMVSGIDISCHVKGIVKAVVYVNIKADQMDEVVSIIAKNKDSFDIEQRLNTEISS